MPGVMARLNQATPYWAVVVVGDRCISYDRE